MKKGSPQVEDGFTRIADEMLEAMAKSFRAPESILIAVIRMTWGYNRKQAAISNKRMCELTGTRRRHIGRDIKRAISVGYISLVTTSGGRHGENPVYSVQKQYLKWFSSPDQVTKSLSPHLGILVTTSGDNTIKEKYIEKRSNPPNPPSRDPKPKWKAPSGSDLISEHPWLNPTIWDEWVEYRAKTKRKPITEPAFRKQIKLLTQYPRQHIEIIETSIQNDWQGLFKPRGLPRPANKPEAVNGHNINSFAEVLHDRQTMGRRGGRDPVPGGRFVRENNDQGYDTPVPQHTRALPG